MKNIGRGEERRAMERKREGEDRRQQRSKRLMSEALLALMSERPFREISVVDICQRAPVHRTTFYAHFEDKDALLRYVLGELSRALEEGAERARPADLRELLMLELRECLSFLKEHRQVFLSGLAGGGGEAMGAIETALAGHLTARFRRDSALLSAPELAETSAWFYAGAILAVVGWWLERGPAISEEELVERVRKLLPAQGGGASGPAGAGR